MTSQTATAFIAVAALAFTQPSEEANSAAAEGIKTRCDELKFNHALAEALRTNVRQAAADLKTIRTETRAFLLAAMLADTMKQRQAYSVIAAYSDAKATTLKAMIDSKSKEIINAADVLEKRNAQLRGAIFAAKTKAVTVSGSIAGALANDPDFGGTAKTCTLKLDIHDKADTECTPTDKYEDQLATLPNQINELTTLYTVGEDTPVTEQLTAVVTTKGNFATSGTTTADGAAYCGNHATRSSAAHAIGLKALSPSTASTEKKAQGLEANGNCIDPGTARKDGLITLKEVAASICGAKKNLISRVMAVSTLSAKQLINDATFQKLAALALGQKKPQNTGGNNDKAPAIQLLGSEETNLKDKYFTPLENQHVEFNLGEELIRTSIKSAASGDNYGAALAFSAGKAANQALQKDMPKGVETKANDDCTGKGKDDCNAKGGCKYNDKDRKCEKDPAKATTAGRPGTKNTTGSNSVIMNKTPLFLHLWLYSYAFRIFLLHFVKYAKISFSESLLNFLKFDIF
ncbi:variant surface glycoprotein [Trypanosoma brucei equiperdum]|uniref:Variant surface glycoprotein n=1 Tax=Trypanosoma brucei equiperdum TaxID=630700 RepID=A0A3L6LBY1_9TRYP|nr:variant surface glycoprotein [Trypanosoma brucei equiperdum]RHW73774.1 variant surface glycoprotein [Trypanosoma brucei equiperdum]RHW73786.1 variant surface glycoprotein [Trypanosoma brucei equiperdum]RHW73795.1 variant surface glycoprotein [Trypanosoma brucei equiperdum]